MRTIEQTVTAGQDITLTGGFRFFQFMSGGAGGTIDVQFYDENGRRSERAQSVETGYKARPDGGFRRITITSNANQTIKFGVSEGSGEYDRLAGSVTAAPDTPNTIETVPNQTIATGNAYSIAADANQRELIITSLNTNTGYVYLQESGAAAAQGIPIQPGEKYTIETQAAVDVYNGSGANQTIAVARNKRI